MNTFGELVKEIRKEKGWLLMDIAEKVGKSVAYISQIERPTSQTIPSKEVGELIIRALGVDAKTRAKLKHALEYDLEHHVVERIFPSSKKLEDFFDETKLSVAAVADQLKDERGNSRSRQIVQVWKNGLQLPMPQTVPDLMKVFRKAGISENRIKEYEDAHLYDTVYFSRDISHFKPSQKEALARTAVKIVNGRHHNVG